MAGLWVRVGVKEGWHDDTMEKAYRGGIEGVLVWCSGVFPGSCGTAGTFFPSISYKVEPNGYREWTWFGV